MGKTILLFWLVLLGFKGNQVPKATFCQRELQIEKAGLVDIQKLDPEILVDLKYSGKDNFIGIDVYGCLSKAYLQKNVAFQLAKASTKLRKLHPELRLLVYDAARPKWAQQILWDSLKKPESQKHVYVADPKKGSIHNYGCAVDITICDKNLKALDMGTSYDFFGLLAQPRKEAEMLRKGQLSKIQVENRKMLRRFMSEAGFQPISSEWWHFNYGSLRSANSKYKAVE